MSPTMTTAARDAAGSADILGLSITYHPIHTLVALGRKTRSHTKDQIQKLATSIRTFGFNVPVLIDEEGKVLAGNARVEAARLIGLAEVPCVQLAHMTEAQKRAFVIASNRIAEESSWDREALKIEFEELAALDLGFSLEVTGFTEPQIDAIVLGGEGGGEKGDAIPAVSGPPVSQVGDLWLMGDHRLLCADATDPASLKTLLGDEQARTVFTDAPYNVPVAGHVTSGGKHGEFAMASGEMSDAEFTDFLIKVAIQIEAALIPGGLAYFCMDHRHIRHTLDGADAARLQFLNLIVWAKPAGGMGSFYRSRHELIFLFKKAGGSHVNRVELGKNGRNRSNVWTYEGVNGFGAAKAKARELHPTVKPLALVRDAILDSTERGEVVLDFFNGSGTTLIAAEQSGRRGRATELDPQYVDVGVIRWQDFTGREATLAATGQTFAQVQAERAALKVTAEPAVATPPPARMRVRVTA